MKNVQATGSVAYLPTKWETAEYKILNFLKGTVKQSLYGNSVFLREEQLISERDMEKTAKEIEKLKLDLIQKEEELKTISYHQSHTVRRPLANIMGIVGLVEHYKQNPPDEDFFRLIELLKISSGELDEVIKNNGKTSRD